MSSWDCLWSIMKSAALSQGHVAFHQLMLLPADSILIPYSILKNLFDASMFLWIDLMSACRRTQNIDMEAHGNNSFRNNQLMPIG